MGGRNVTYLLVLSVTIEDSAGNLVLDALRELLNGAVVDGGALAVATSDNDTVGALAGHVVQGILHPPLADGVGTTGQEVGGDQGSVVDTLSGNVVAAEDGLEAIRGRRANNGALFLVSA